MNKIEKMNISEIEEVNRLIVRSRSLWDYEKEYFQESISLIHINQEWLVRNIGFTIKNDSKILGFIGLQEKSGEHWLEHLWIDPQSINRGLGREAIEFVVGLLKIQKIPRIFIFPEPLAESFYLKVGAIYTGDKSSSRINGGPVFSKMVIEL